jgi:hypothetical protein
MDFKTFESQFVPFCKTPGVESQKPSSYYRAIQYLAEYLGISDINNDNAKIILAKEDEVKDKSSSFYKALLRDLELKGRKSYLENGFMSAAFPFFRRFLSNDHVKVSKTSADENEKQQMRSLQAIFFGAPGTGKSYKVNGIIQNQQVFRTTFHPDYDYAQFVGAYKPKKDDKDGKITYVFVPQVFAKAYAAAWKLQLTGASEANVFLVIEEINRGNCAQIFGDIFQLLDRDDSGASQYSIDADCDFAEWLQTSEDGLKSVWNEYKEAVGEGKLKLPPNLNILATMNTSDQSLFPMDSAFKRRFDWEYVPISFEGKDAANYKIEVSEAEETYSWKDFVEKVNKKILGVTKSEDKQLGEFFIKPDKKGKDEKLLLISEKRFLGKVMFYLWNDVCKDEHENESFFRIKDDGYFTFQDLYKPEKKSLLKKFMDELMKEEG